MNLFSMKIGLFARALTNMQLYKISKEFGLISNLASLPKIKDTHFKHHGPLESNIFQLTS